MSRLEVKRPRLRKVAMAIACGGQSSLYDLHVIWADDDEDSPAKMLDYSAASVAGRWGQGYRAMTTALDDLEALSPPTGKRPFSAYWHDGSGLRSYD
jgi:hypothetical protein